MLFMIHNFIFIKKQNTDMKKILLIIILLTNFCPMIMADGDETEIIYLNSGERTGNDRDAQIEAYFSRVQCFVEVRFPENELYTVTVTDSFNQIVLCTYIDMAGIFKYRVSDAPGVYTLNIDYDSYHLSGHYMI